MFKVWKRQQVHEDVTEIHRAAVTVRKPGKMVKETPGKPRFGEKNGYAGGGCDLVQKMLGIRETENGTKIDELLQARTSGHKRPSQDVETNSDSRRRQGSCQGGQKLED